MKTILVAAFTVFMSALPSLADLSSNVDVSAVAGTGTSKGYCVIDFGNTSYAFQYKFDGTAYGWDMLQSLDANTGLDVQVNWWNFGTPADPYWVPFPKAFGYGNDAADDNDGSYGKYWAYYISKDGKNWVESDQGVGDREIGVYAEYDGTPIESEGWIWEGWSWVPGGWGTQKAPRTPVLGDANGDYAVTDADYTAWANSYGQANATWAMGDFNHDHAVTDADYTLWSNNYRVGVPSGVVPEPASLALLTLAGLGLRRRR